MTDPTTELADKDCQLLDALDFQVGAVARVQGEYAQDWPEPVRIVGIERYRTGRLNITIAELDGNSPTDGFSINEIVPRPRHRLSTRSPPEQVEVGASVYELQKTVGRLCKALRSIADSACCGDCQEAALVARNALEGRDTSAIAALGVSPR